MRKVGHVDRICSFGLEIVVTFVFLAVAFYLTLLLKMRTETLLAVQNMFVTSGGLYLVSIFLMHKETRTTCFVLIRAVWDAVFFVHAVPVQAAQMAWGLDKVLIVLKFQYI